MPCCRRRGRSRRSAARHPADTSSMAPARSRCRSARRIRPKAESTVCIRGITHGPRHRHGSHALRGRHLGGRDARITTLPRSPAALHRPHCRLLARLQALSRRGRFVAGGIVHTPSAGRRRGLAGPLLDLVACVLDLSPLPQPRISQTVYPKCAAWMARSISGPEGALSEEGSRVAELTRERQWLPLGAGPRALHQQRTGRRALPQAPVAVARLSAAAVLDRTGCGLSPSATRFTRTPS